MADGDTVASKIYLVPPGHSHSGTSPENLANLGAGMGNNQVLCLSVVIAARAASNGAAFGYVGRILVKKDNAGTVTGTLAGDVIDPGTLGWTVDFSSPQLRLTAASGARSTVVLRGVRLEHA